MNEVTDFIVSFWNTAPTIVRGLLVLLGGWLIGLITRALVVGVLAVFQFDRFADRSGLSEFLRNGRVTQRPSRLVGLFVFRVVILISFLLASRALDITAVNGITDSLVQSLPAVTAAIFVTLVGVVVVAFLANVLETILRNTSLTNVRAIANGFRLVGYGIILLLASDQLGFGKSLLSSLLLIVFAAVALGFAIAFGLGSVDAARRTVETFLKSREKPGSGPDSPRNEG